LKKPALGLMMERNLHKVLENQLFPGIDATINKTEHELEVALWKALFKTCQIRYGKRTSV
jgi:hypothetical protein